ncbi:patatin-like phospholipase family protein [Sandaracinobacteroides saxicola]|uniref:Patatin-like phospholipase family protein n=1 Tax=Sandaracinobacteroides saxicola TaxID=2759707 RepID=A0A7G5IKY2_9SPHN|nr:patatin-like phospholipase family protein [Sandaracinobacteroides saxicola]QMW24024.1 patatin-like phospholipase family protein [Sandaracinobacteroides saxicola]
MAAGIAVVLSGGGAKGAFQVGVLDELISARKVAIDIFAGVSTGAIQALGGAQDDMPGLLDAWLGLRGNEDVYRPKPLGIIGGLLGASSLYDPAPIRARIRRFADPAKLAATGKKLLLGVVNLQSGAFRSIHENTPNIADWVYASSAQPPFFPPLTTRDAAGAQEQWVDGGVRNVTPLSAALDWNPRAVIVVMASPLAAAAPVTRQYDSLVSIALRSVGILTSEVVANDIGQAALINALIAARGKQAAALAKSGITGTAAAAILAPLDAQLSTYRFAPIHIIAPAAEISDTLEFDPAKIRAGIAAGRKAVADDWPALSALIG